MAINPIVQRAIGGGALSVPGLAGSIMGRQAPPPPPPPPSWVATEQAVNEYLAAKGWDPNDFYSQKFKQNVMAGRSPTRTVVPGGFGGTGNPNLHPNAVPGLTLTMTPEGWEQERRGVRIWTGQDIGPMPAGGVTHTGRQYQIGEKMQFSGISPQQQALMNARTDAIMQFEARKKAEKGGFMGQLGRVIGDLAPLALAAAGGAGITSALGAGAGAGAAAPAAAGAAEAAGATGLASLPSSVLPAAEAFGAGVSPGLLSPAVGAAQAAGAGAAAAGAGGATGLSSLPSSVSPAAEAFGPGVSPNLLSPAVEAAQAAGAGAGAAGVGTGLPNVPTPSTGLDPFEIDAAQTSGIPGTPGIPSGGPNMTDLLTPSNIATAAGAAAGALGSDTEPATSQTVTQPWEPSQQYLIDAMQKALALTNRPLPYASAEEMVAPLTPDQLAAISASTGISMEALQALTRSFGGLSDIMNGKFLDINNFPFAQDAMRAAITPLTEQFTEGVLPAIRGGYRAGAGQDFGSTREGIAQGIGAGKLSRASGEITSKMANEMFGQGLNATMQGFGILPSTVNAAKTPIDMWLQSAALPQANQQAVIDARKALYDMPFTNLQKASNIYSQAAGGGRTTTTVEDTADSNPFMSGVGGALAARQLAKLIFG